MWILEFCIGIALCKDPVMLLTPTKKECESVQVSVVTNAMNKPGVYTRCRVATVEEIMELSD